MRTFVLTGLTGVVIVSLLFCGATRAQSAKTRVKSEPARAQPAEAASVYDLPGVLGVKWGDSKERARKVLKNQGLIIGEKYSNEVMLLIENNTVFGFEADTTTFLFTEKGFYSANIVFKRAADDKVKSQYKRIQERISEKYKTPDGSEDKSSYDGDGFSNSHWVFDAGRHSIGFMLDYDSDLTLRYEVVDVSRKEVEKALRGN